MSKQFHFIVVMEENGKARIDYDVPINDDAGEVWDPESNEWLSAYDVAEDYEKMAEKLWNLINNYQEQN